METKKREKILLMIVGGCAALWLLNMLVITPLYNVWAGRQKEIADLRKQLADGKQTIRRADLIEAKWNHMYLNTFSPNSTAAESQMFKSFSSWASDSGVTLVSQKPENREDDPTLPYKNEECHVNVTGFLSQIAQFLYDVESSQKGLKVDSVEFTTRDDTGRQLSLDLTVSGLVLNAPTNTTE
jgi:Tfp pilus assembly protein PilO